MNIYTGYVCINGHIAGLKKDLPTLFFSSPLRQYNHFLKALIRLGSGENPDHVMHMKARAWQFKAWE